MISLSFTLLFLVHSYTPFCISCLEKILWHLLKSWFGGPEFSQLLLVCKAFDFSFKSKADPCCVRVILAVSFFPFITLSISCHFLPACTVSLERSAVGLMVIPLYVICCFSLAAFNICSLCLIFVNLIDMCLGVFLFGLSWVGLFVVPGLGCLLAFPF